MTKQCRHGFDFLSCCNCMKDEIERLTKERDEYKAWWERDSKNLGTALNDLSLERACKQDLQAQVKWQSNEIDAQVGEIQRLRGHEPSAPQTGWLIEWPVSDNLPARWWHPVTGWMIDASKAARFSRKQDAEAYIGAGKFGQSIVATEHMWGL